MTEPSAKSRKTRVEEMIKAATAENWDVFLGYFSRDLYYKLGVAERVDIEVRHECVWADLRRDGDRQDR